MEREARGIDRHPRPITDTERAMLKNEFVAMLHEQLGQQQTFVLAAVAEAIAEIISHERDLWEKQLRELNLETAKLASALAAINDMLAAEKAKVIDLPRLPLRGDLN